MNCYCRNGRKKKLPSTTPTPDIHQTATEDDYVTEFDLENPTSPLTSTTAPKPQPSKTTSSTINIALTCTGVLLVALIVVCLLWREHRRRRSRRSTLPSVHYRASNSSTLTPSSSQLLNGTFFYASVFFFFFFK
jgi:hypothetical protein